MHKPLKKNERQRFLKLLLGQCAGKNGVRVVYNARSGKVTFTGLTEAMKKDFNAHRGKVLSLLKGYEDKMLAELQRHQQQIEQIENETEEQFWGYAIDNGLYAPTGRVIQMTG